MYIKEAHILIEQGLQNIGVFANLDVLPDELDLAIHNEMWKVLEEEFSSLKGEQNNIFKHQASLDKYKILIEKETLVGVTLTDGLYNGTLPNNYYHLIKDRSIVLYKCATCRITSGNIVDGEWYIVEGRTITYNGIPYTKGQIFKGISATSTFTSTISTTPIIVWKLKRKSSPNRLTEEEYVDSINANSLTKTNRNSPLSVITKDTITVYVDDFFIEKIYISYLRKPNIPYISFTKYTNASVLVVGTEYEVISGSITYNSSTYQARPQYQFDSFVVVTGVTSFTGSGIVRVKGQGDIELPRQTALKIIDNVIIMLSAVSEQNQQKIVNLSQLNK